MHKYRYLAWDPETDLPREELPFSAVSFGGVLNNAGPFRASISGRHPKARPDVLDPGRTYIYVERFGTIIWGGFLWQVSAQSGPEVMGLSLTGQEMWSYFQEISSCGRYIRDSKIYNQQDQLFIVRDLINYTQDTTIHGSNADIGVQTGTELSGILRDASYSWLDRENVGKAVEHLAALSNGFEFLINCYYSGGTVAKALNLYYPTFPQSDIPVLLKYPDHIISYTNPMDALPSAQLVDALGAGEGAAALIATSSIYLPSYPLREKVNPYKDVSYMSTLQAHADADVMRALHPKPIPTLICTTNTQEIAPGSFKCGSLFHIHIDDGWTQIDDDYRVAQYEVRVDDDEQEMMTIRFMLGSDL
jgi:hypothetical protein